MIDNAAGHQVCSDPDSHDACPVAPSRKSAPRQFAAKITVFSLVAVIVGSIILRPESLGVLAQCGLMTLLQIPLHEFAHYLVARKFYQQNMADEIQGVQKPLTARESAFVKTYLAPRFGLNLFYGIDSLKVVPAIFIQELNYTGRQMALITSAGPLVDISMALIYITVGIVLGPRTFFGFLTTQTMIYFSVITIVIWGVAYLIKALDLGKYRYSVAKRNASNRFLMGAWYLEEAILDEEGQLTVDDQPGHRAGMSRLRYLLEQVRRRQISAMNLEILIEAFVAANPPLARLVRAGVLAQQLAVETTLRQGMLAELEAEIINAEKALEAHKAIAWMKTPVYIGLDLVAMGYGVHVSGDRIQTLLGRMKKRLGVPGNVSFVTGGGKLILVAEKAEIAPGGIASLLASRDFGDFIRVRRVNRERTAFEGRRTIQVGIARMKAPEGVDFSRELAHAEVLWDMIRPVAPIG